MQREKELIQQIVDLKQKLVESVIEKDTDKYNFVKKTKLMEYKINYYENQIRNFNSKKK